MDYKKISAYFIPSISDVLFAVLLVALFLTGSGLLGDGDTGYHIRTGQIILDTLSVPRLDPYSYLTPALPWTAHEWLSEVIMAGVHGVLGLTGVVLLFVLLIAVTYAYLYKSLRAQHGNLWLLLFVILLVMSSSTLHWLARPHIFSLLFLVIFYDLLDRFQYENKNYLYLLPLIMLLWVNLHGGFIIGLILLGVYFLGNLIYWFQTQPGKRENYFERCKIIGLVGLSCLLVSLINPYGFHLLLFPFKLVGDHFIMSVINEFMPTNLQIPRPYNLYLLLTFAILMLSRHRVNFIELILIILFVYMSLYSVRYITFFAIIAAPIILKRMDGFFRETENKIVRFLNRRSDSIAATDAQTRGCFWPISAFVIVLVLAFAGTVNLSFNPKEKPVKAVEFLQKEHITGNMFNNDEFGDYLIYASFPKYKVFIDGRGDMYGANLLKDYICIKNLGAGWGKRMIKYQIKWVFFSADSILSRYLQERPDWHLIYADKVAHIYVRDIPQYRYLIERYRGVRPVVGQFGIHKDFKRGSED